MPDLEPYRPPIQGHMCKIWGISSCSVFFSRPSPKAGHELQTALDTMREEEDDGPLAKNQPEPVTGPLGQCL